ncbi:MAG: O-antigen ligase family protein [Candidatus Velthaea sp.]
MIDRCVVVALAAMYAFFPLYGTYAVFAPHPPTAPLVPRAVAILFAAIMLLAMATAAAGAARRRAPQPLRGPLLANAAATYVGAALGFNPAVGLGLATGVAGLVATHFALIAYYRDRNVARVIYLALLVSGLMSSLVAIVLVLVRAPADLYAYNHGRAVGTFLNPNELAAFLLAYLGAACGLAMVRRGTPLGTFAAVCAVVGAVALTLTFSRWGLAAALAGIVFFALAMRERRGVAAALGVLAVAAAINAAAWNRHHDPQDTGVRGVAWRAGIRTFLHFPLTGVGPLAFERLYPVMRAPDAPGPDTPVAYDPHDLALSIAAETGALGLGAIVFGFVRLGGVLARALASADRRRRTLTVALAAGIVAVVVHSLLNSVSIAFSIIAQFAALAIAAANWEFEPHAS